jgi:hypothetical protein
MQSYEIILPAAYFYNKVSEKFYWGWFGPVRFRLSGGVKDAFTGILGHKFPLKITDSTPLRSSDSKKWLLRIFHSGNSEILEILFQSINGSDKISQYGWAPTRETPTIESKTLILKRLINRHFRIDLQGPGMDAAFQVQQVFVPEPLA